MKNIKFKDGKMFTLNLTPKKTFFEFEKTENIGGREYRFCDPKRSKLAAAIKKGLKIEGLDTGTKVLYLGASHGYTPSFVSDIVGENGFVHCVDISSAVVTDLLLLCEQRENMSPVLADANQPYTFIDRIVGVDFLYQDIAQRNQVEIFLKNIKIFLKKGGYGFLAVKARSIDVTKNPVRVFKDVEERLKKEKDIIIVDWKSLHPLEKDHAVFLIKRN